MFGKIGLLLFLGSGILARTNRPFVYACIYSLFGCFVNFMIGYQFIWLVTLLVAALSLSFCYFWLLDRYEERRFIWYLILFLGLPIALV